MTGKMKQIIALALIIVLALPLAGCRGGAKEGNVELSPYVYVPEFNVLEDVRFSPSVIKGDMIYAIGTTYGDGETPQSSTFLYSVKMGENKINSAPIVIDENTSVSQFVCDSSGAIKVFLTTYLYDEEPVNAEEVAGEAKPDEDADAAKEEAGAEDTAAEETTDEEAADEETTDEETADAEGSKSTGSSGSGTVLLSSNGGASVVSTTSVAVGGFDEGDDYTAPIGQKIEIATIAMDGSITERIDITSSFEDPQNAYIQHMAIDGEDNIYLAMQTGILVIDKAGTMIANIALDQDVWIDGMFALKSGSVAVSFYGQNGGMEMRQVDPVKKELGESAANLNLSMYGNIKAGPAVNSDLLMSMGNTLYSYTWGEQPVELLNWINSDVNSDEVVTMAEMEDGRILAVIVPWNMDASDAMKSTTELAYLTKKDRSEVKEKALVTLGTISMSQTLQRGIIEFNKSSQLYRVEVKDYLKDDYNAAVTQMNADIVSGKSPDIISIGFGNSFTQYTSKGLLEDLNPYFEKDEEIKKADYLENIINVYSLDDKLYAVGTRFFINTIVGKQSVLGDRKSITVQELMDLMKDQPEGTSLYEYATKTSVLTNSLSMNLDSYIDWQTGKCNFNQEEFMQLLEFSNTFPKDFDYNQERKLAESVRSGKLLMINASISSVQEYQMYDGLFGEPLSFVGYPTTKDNGSGISMSGTTLAISSKSKNKDGAWAFIREGLKEEAQNSEDMEWGFPLLKSALEARFAEDMTKEYYEDANGDQVEQMKTSWGFDDFNMDIYAASEEQVNAVRDMINGLTSIYEYNEQIYNIINEEVAPYFEGQKSAKEVVDIIQSRVQIYVNENR